MSQQIINISTPDDGLGDVLRNGFDKTNQNFTELYNGKVNKVAGKGLSENDFTDADKAKLNGIEAGAQVNVQADAAETDPLSPSYIQNFPPSLYSAVGHFHYADLATQTTPLAVVANVPTKITNNTLGTNTELGFAPYAVPTVWDDIQNSFDFSFLDLGDSASLRLDLAITTTSANQTIQLYLNFGVGTASEYDLLIDSWNEKSTVTFKHFLKTIDFSIDNPDWKSAPAELYILSDANASVKVNGFYVPIIRKSVNIIDVEGGSQNLQQVTDLGNSTTNFIEVPMLRLKEGALEVDISASALTATRELFAPDKNGTIAIVEDTVAKVSTSGVERAYIINADGSQATKPTSEFGGSTETFNQSTWEFSDFVDESVNQKPFTGAALAGGSQDVSVYSDSAQDFIGARLLFSGTSANGGFRYLNSTNPGFGGMRSAGGLTFYGIFILNTQSIARDRVIRIGFHNATSGTTTPTDGAYLEILGNTATFKTRNNSVESASSSVVLANGYATSGVFYKVLIEFTSTTSVNFKMVDNSGTVVLNTPISTNVPSVGRRFGFGLVATIATAGTNHQIMSIDYMGMGRQKPNFLNGF